MHFTHIDYLGKDGHFPEHVSVDACFFPLVSAQNRTNFVFITCCRPRTDTYTYARTHTHPQTDREREREGERGRERERDRERERVCV